MECETSLSFPEKEDDCHPGEWKGQTDAGGKGDALVSATPCRFHRQDVVSVFLGAHRLRWGMGAGTGHHGSDGQRAGHLVLASEARSPHPFG